ncbi:Mov34/MPN/PAD-1 family protein [Crenothrix polyspora]|uniref:Mov34/MPN/PAD-1 family protein n=1 Tax=Crenothrix polyspora TaxID=360316 RepID=A0A1R4HJL6_9GAMM|nr:M67 family metallopeptidase [Crenothrix polyspora]SJM96428.1 Mov34/MPN/PAD-1 family protein [Crenothrix polyspora]
MLAGEIQLSRKLTTELLHLAQISPDQEICGLVSSINHQPAHCYPIKNVATLPQQQFLLDAEQQIAAIKTMREQGEELFAIYHSHPTSPAIPSTTDLELAAYDDALYLIISLNTKGVLEMRGFHIHEKTAQEVVLTLANER